MNYVETVQRIGAFLLRHGFDLILVLLAIEGILEANGQSAESNPSWLELAAVIGLILPLFARRRFPFAAPLAVWLLASTISFIDGELIPSTFSVYATGVAATYLLGNLADSFQSRVGLAVALIGSAVVVFNDPAHVVSDFVSVPATFTVAWLAGQAMRSRADRAEEAEERAATAERERESAARVAVAEERARITRELHDIVAHAVSVMVLHVGAVRHRLPDDLAEDRSALRAVEETGRAALGEMRRLLSSIHDDGRDVALSPQPGLDRLGALVEEVRLAGLHVDLRVEGEPVPLPRAIDLSAYRIVQEGLTNALKHAGAERAEVTVRYAGGGVELEVLDDGVGVTASDGLGRGLTGVRERVKIYGGEMTAGDAPGGGFLLRARLPARGSQG